MISTKSTCFLRAVAILAFSLCASMAAVEAYAAPPEAAQKKNNKTKTPPAALKPELPTPPPLPSKGPNSTPAAAIAPGDGKLEPQKPLVPFGPPPPPEVWSPEQIREAAAECSNLLRGQPIEFEALQPIREGSCGAPAPLKVEAFVREPALEIRPAAIMTCKMTAALNEWIEKVVQPRAKELLHANIIRISNVASYHCRHRYNDPLQRISNHAYAGALDISEFLTAKGERINVLEHWPLDDERSKFLKDIHKGACEIFGTTLGPEANEAHKNHFHLDAQTRRKPFCDGVKDKTGKESAEATSPDPQAKSSDTQSTPGLPAQPKKR